MEFHGVKFGFHLSLWYKLELIPWKSNTNPIILKRF